MPRAKTDPSSRTLRYVIASALLTAVLTSIGWHLAHCLADQRKAVSATREQWSKVRVRTQKYFDDEDAFYDRTLAFLEKVHGGRRVAALIETEKQELISAIPSLTQECNDLRIARYDFASKWNHMESIFMIPPSTFADISEQCAHWPLFAEELRSADSSQIVTDPSYDAEFYSNRKQVAQAKEILATYRKEERGQAERVDAILKDADAPALAGNCWTCTKTALRLK